MEPEIGSILEGKVASIVKFGAFVSLPEGKSGLVHISEIANTYVNDVNDFLHEGDTVKVKVLSAENGRINLSIKKALPPPAAPANRASAPMRRPGASPRPAQGWSGNGRGGQVLSPTGDVSFEDKLKQFMSASEGKMADLNRSLDGKRGGKRRK